MSFFSHSSFFCQTQENLISIEITKVNSTNPSLRHKTNKGIRIQWLIKLDIYCNNYTITIKDKLLILYRRGYII